LATGQKGKYTKFVFIGAGGGSLPLLEKQMFQKEKVLAVSRKWTMAQMYQSDVAKHQSKYTVKLVWGTAYVSSAYRFKNDQWRKQLLFGPLLVFSRFLKNGSYSDLPLSIKPDNIFPMLSAGIKNIPLTKYLIQQVRQSPKDRIDALKECTEC
jgi:malate dehydrogenase (quinone)